MLDLKAVGTHRYVADPSFLILIINYAIDDGSIISQYNSNDAKFFQHFADALVAAKRIVAHNVQFEQAVTACVIGDNMKVLPNQKWICTAARARRCGLPSSLRDAAKALQLSVQKDTRGKQLIRKLCRPRADGTFCEDPELLEELASYGATDVEVCRQLDHVLPELDQIEHNIYYYDMLLNARGVGIDIKLLANMRHIADEATDNVDKAVSELTNNKITSIAQRDRILSWLADYVCVADDLSRQTVRTLLDEHTLPEPVQKMLLLRVEGSRTSTRKLEAFWERHVNGRLYGSLLYYGAHTGRHSSIGVQLQNLPRPERPWWMLQEAIENLHTLDSESLRLLYGAPLSLIADLLRSLIVPKPGYAFEICDLNAIELRVAAWLAGEEHLLTQIREGVDTYCVMASDIVGREITPADEKERFLGKTLMLAGQYGIGWQRFQRTCETQGHPIDELLARISVNTYRDTHQAIISAWVVMDCAARLVTEKGGKKPGGPHISFELRGDWLLMHLPSGRPLYYYKPQVEEDQHGAERVTYLGVNSVTHQFERIRVWGGSLFEHAVQAISRDVLMNGCIALEVHQHPVSLIVHDEVVCEVPARRADVRAVETIMSQSPVWAQDLPLQAKGIVSERYRKI